MFWKSANIYKLFRNARYKYVNWFCELSQIKNRPNNWTQTCSSCLSLSFFVKERLSSQLVSSCNWSQNYCPVLSVTKKPTSAHYQIPMASFSWNYRQSQNSKLFWMTIDNRDSKLECGNKMDVKSKEPKTWAIYHCKYICM
jgi:hypothetical protein